MNVDTRNLPVKLTQDELDMRRECMAQNGCESSMLGSSHVGRSQ